MAKGLLEIRMRKKGKLISPSIQDYVRRENPISPSCQRQELMISSQHSIVWCHIVILHSYVHATSRSHLNHNARLEGIIILCLYVVLAAKC